VSADHLFHFFNIMSRGGKSTDTKCLLRFLRYSSIWDKSIASPILPFARGCYPPHNVCSLLGLIDSNVGAASSRDTIGCQFTLEAREEYPCDALSSSIFRSLV
jgi:hypothetical protein